MKLEHTVHYQAPGPLGWLRLTLTESDAVTAAGFVDRPGKNQIVPTELATALDVYFKNSTHLPKHLFQFPSAATDWQRAVWHTIAAVPQGKTITYTELAAGAGRPQAARSAGTTCGRNPLALFIPCHRVVRKTGEDFGYSWGEARKRWLLEHEGAI